MSKIALYLALAGAGTAGAVTVMVMTGVIQMPGARDVDAPVPAAVLTAPDAPVAPTAPEAEAPLATAAPAKAPDADPVAKADAPDPAPVVETVDAPDPATPVPVPVPEPTPEPEKTADAPAPPATAATDVVETAAPAVSPAETVKAALPAETAAAAAAAPDETSDDPAPVETAAAPVPREAAAATDAVEPDPEAAAAPLLPLLDAGAGQVVPELLLDGDEAVKRPSFDVVRAETDGFSLIAGGGEPGAMVEVIVNGRPVETLEIGGDGKFTTFLNLPPDGASVISLRQTADERTVLSEGEVIVAPQQVAAADIAPERQPKTPVDTGPLLEKGPGPDGPDPDNPDGDPAALAPAPVGDGETVAVPGPEVDPGRAEEAPLAASEDLARALPQPEVGAGPDPLGAPKWNGAPARGPVPGTQPAPEASASPLRPGGVPGSRALVDSKDPNAPLVAAVDPAALAAADPAADPAEGADTARPAADPAITARAEPNVRDAPSTPRAPTVLLSTPRGVEALSTAPIAPGDVALDSISYDEKGDVLLSGRGKTAAFVRIYLDNTPVTTSRIREDGGWRVQLPEVDQGTYVLRIDQIDERGQVLARVESPFLRESAAVLESAVAAGTGRVRTVTIQPGNTLWGISRNRYGDGMQYVRIFEANKDRIRDPDLIYPGQIFALPEGGDN